jgi:hypothetical protein
MRQTANATSVTAPVGGLNDRDSIAEMPARDAVIMDNWWPYPSYVGIRKGRMPQVTGFSSPVETISEYLPPVSGGNKLFAASGTGIYDVTTAGTVGAAVVTGLTNARFQDVILTTPAGTYLYMVNGVDDPRLYNGTTWTAINGASTPAITGVTTNLFAHVTLFKNRLFFTEKNSARIWYLPVNSIGGAASMLDLGSIFKQGGYIMACYTWTLDAGNGSDDHFVIISSNGEVAVYRGTDPSNSTSWGLVGVFSLGRPLGRRCGIKYGGDLVINTMEGIFPLGKGLLSSSIDRTVALSDKIQNSVSLAANTYEGNFGWQVTLFPSANMLMVNIPAGNGQNYQFCQNTITQAWSKFIGWNANAWCNASTGLYFGDANSVQRAWIGNLDSTTPIQADILPSFSYFGSKASNKYFTMVRPYLLSGGSPSVSYGLNTDFSVVDVTNTLSYTAPTGMVWGLMVWGSMVWGGGLTSITNWQTVGSVANSAALRMKVLNNGAEVRFTSVDFVYQNGGIL